MQKKINILVVALTLITGTPCFAMSLCGSRPIDDFTCSEVSGWSSAVDGDTLNWGDYDVRSKSGLESLVSTHTGSSFIMDHTIPGSGVLIDGLAYAFTRLGQNKASTNTTSRLVEAIYSDYPGQPEHWHTLAGEGGNFAGSMFSLPLLLRGQGPGMITIGGTLHGWVVGDVAIADSWKGDHISNMWYDAYLLLDSQGGAVASFSATTDTGYYNGYVRKTILNSSESGNYEETTSTLRLGTSAPPAFYLVDIPWTIHAPIFADDRLYWLTSTLQVQSYASSFDGTNYVHDAFEFKDTATIDYLEVSAGYELLTPGSNSLILMPDGTYQFLANLESSTDVSEPTGMALLSLGLLVLVNTCRHKRPEKSVHLRLGQDPV